MVYKNSFSLRICNQGADLKNISCIIAVCYFFSFYTPHIFLMFGLFIYTFQRWNLEYENKAQWFSICTYSNFNLTIQIAVKYDNLTLWVNCSPILGVNSLNKFLKNFSCSLNKLDTYWTELKTPFSFVFPYKVWCWEVCPRHPVGKLTFGGFCEE